MEIIKAFKIAKLTSKTSPKTALNSKQPLKKKKTSILSKNFQQRIYKKNLLSNTEKTMQTKSKKKIVNL